MNSDAASPDGGSAVPLPYAAPELRTDPPAEALDHYRLGVQLLAAVLFALSVLTLGAAGVARTATALWSTGASQVVVWPVLAFAVFGAGLFALLPTQRSARRQQAAGLLLACTAALFGCSQVLAAAFLPWTAVVAAVAATWAAALGLRELNRHTAGNLTERLGTDVPLGLLTGYGLVFTTELFFSATQWNEQAWAGLVAVLVLAVLGAGAAHGERGRHSVAMGFLAGMLPVALGQWRDPGLSWWLPVSTALGAVIVLIAAETRRHQVTHAEHRAARHHASHPADPGSTSPEDSSG
ncbi:hypothetical protein [Glutamicibacter creatinolyticus]|uniref:hypothetical protein n=1 Tax=Glutamicibacter creatinolyticus TaxID=162496 RepID=UPI003217613C